METITEFAYAGRDNSIDIELSEDGAVQDITGLTRATLTLQNMEAPDDALVLVDSDLHAGIFDWSTRGAAGVLLIAAGVLGTLLGQTAPFNARLTVYDATNPNGLDWTHEVTTGCDGTRLIIRAFADIVGVAA